MTKSIVVVHGVGSPKLGSEIKKIADAISDADSTMQLSSIRSKETDVAMGELIHKGQTVRLYELNWSHFIRPARSARHTLGQVFCLVFAAAQIAQSGWHGQTSDSVRTVNGPSWIGRVYRWVLVTITIWAPILAATVIMAEILNDAYAISATMIALCVGGLVGLAAYLLRNIEPLATWSGLIWAVMIASLGVSVAQGVLDRVTLSTYVTRPLVFAGIYGSGLLLLLGIAESFWRGKGVRSTIRASSFRASMFVIPFVVLAAAWGPIVFTAQFMVIDLFISDDPLTFKDVKAVYDAVAENLPYDIVTLEIINLVAFCVAVTALVTFFLIWHVLLGSTFAKSKDWGGQFRRLVASWLLLLILVGIVTVTPVMIQSLDSWAHKITGKSQISETGMIGELLDFLPIPTEGITLGNLPGINVAHCGCCVVPHPDDCSDDRHFLPNYLLCQPGVVARVQPGRPYLNNSKT